MGYQIGGKTIEENSEGWVDIPVAGEVNGSTYNLSFHVINGADDGPTLWIQGALHGPEHVGPLAIRDLLDGIDPEDVSGTIIGLPVANESALMNRQRESPIDHKDLNRHFPGSDNGTFSDLLANKLLTVAKSHADYFVDMHSGGNRYEVPGFSLYPKTGNSVEETSRELAEISDLPHAVSFDTEGSGVMAARLADEGIPIVITETGGGVPIQDHHYESAVKALQNIAYAIGTIQGDPQRANDVSYHDGLHWIYCNEGGFFDAKVDGNEKVAEGEVIAEITDIKGNVKEQIKAPTDCFIPTVRSYPVARPGSWAFEYTSLEKDIQ